MEGKTEEMEKVNREAKEEECNSRTREFEGEEEGVAVVCKGPCHESHSGMNLEEEGVDLLEDGNEYWCEASMCVPASVSIDFFVRVVCDVNSPSSSVSDCDFVKPQTFSFL